MFNEQTVTENGIIDRLKGLSGVKWTYCHGENLPKQAQDIFVDEWLKDALCSLNPDIGRQSDYADEVIYKLRGVVLEARHTGLVKANENFQEWLMADKTLPFGENGDHITINLIDFDNIENNHFVVAQQVHYIAATEVYFDIVLYVNGIPLVVGEVKTATRPSVTWQDGAADFMGGKKLNLSLSLTCCALPAKEKPLPMARLMHELKTGGPGIILSFVMRFCRAWHRYSTAARVY